MVDLPISHDARTGGNWGPSWFKAMFAHGREFFELLGAAIRIANAVENKVQPRAADLKTLGIPQGLPRTL